MIAMPLADRNLQEIFTAERPHPGALPEMSRQIAAACAELHKRCVVHGDLKLKNVVRGGEGKLVLIDLDCASKVGSDACSKWSSGILPPRMFYKLKSFEEENE